MAEDERLERTDKAAAENGPDESNERLQADAYNRDDAARATNSDADKREADKRESGEQVPSKQSDSNAKSKNSESELVFTDPFSKAANKAENTGKPDKASGGRSQKAAGEKGEKDSAEKQERVSSDAAEKSSTEDKFGKSAEKAGEKKSELPSPEERSKDLKEFSDWLKSNFSKLDGNGDGKISKPELEEKMLDSKFGNGENAPKLVALHNQFSNLSEILKKDPEVSQAPDAPVPAGGGGYEPEFITKQNLEKLESFANDKDYFKRNESDLNVSRLNKQFENLNTDKKETPLLLTPNEVDQALKREELTPSQKQALTVLRKFMEEQKTKKFPQSYVDETSGQEYVSEQKPDAAFASFSTRERKMQVSRNDIVAQATPEARVLEGVSNSMRIAKDRLSDANKEENKDRISQGTDGSCFFLAPAISMQKQDASALKDMIKDNKDGTYTVTFPGDKENPITVKESTDAEMANWANGKQAAILEKAFGEYYSKKMVEQPDRESGAEPQSLIPSARIQGGDTAQAIKLLTGKDAEAFAVQEKSDEDLRNFLSSQSEKGTPLAADSSPYVTGDSGIVSRHSYSVQYDKANDRVVFENPVKPVGKESNKSSYPYEPHKINGSPLDGNNDGKFSMPLSEFKKYFNRIVGPKS